MKEQISETEKRVAEKIKLLINSGYSEAKIAAATNIAPMTVHNYKNSKHPASIRKIELFERLINKLPKNPR